MALWINCSLSKPEQRAFAFRRGSGPLHFFLIFLFRRQQLHLDRPNRERSTMRLRRMPGLRAFRVCRIKSQSEEHATDPPFHRQFALSEVWSVAEVPPAAISCGQVFAPFGRLLPFRGLSSLKAFRNACEASSHGRRLRVATFSSALSTLGRRCYLEQILARGVSLSKSRCSVRTRMCLPTMTRQCLFRQRFGRPISSSRRYSDISPVQLSLSISNQDQMV